MIRAVRADGGTSRRLTRRAIVGGAALTAAAAVAPTAVAGLPRRETGPDRYLVETVPPKAPPTVTAEPAPTEAPTPEPVWVNGKLYEAYVPAATKTGQYFWYTCEFDASWVILETFGVSVSFEEQLEIVGYNQNPEPWYDGSGPEVLIYGGDIEENFCGDYTKNIVAKVQAPAMRKVFDAYGFKSQLIRKQTDVRRCLRRGGLAWFKATVDFKPYTPATWIADNGNRYPVPFTNDHAVVVMGFNRDVVVIRDVLGPTDTNWDRQYEYEVPWDVFWASAMAHDISALAVYPPEQ